MTGNMVVSLQEETLQGCCLRVMGQLFEFLEFYFEDGPEMAVHQ